MTNIRALQRRGGLRRRLVAGLVLLAAMAPTIPAVGQQWVKESLTRGKVWVSINSAFQLGGTIDVGSQYYAFDYPGYSTGANLQDHMGYASASGFMIYGVRSGQAHAYTTSTNFYPSDQYVFETEPTKLIRNYNLEDSSLPFEEAITGAHVVRGLDVEVAHRSMVWSFPKYDDFVIHEITLTNVGEGTVADLHFGTRVGAWNTQKGDLLGPGSGNDDKYGWSEDAEVFYVYDDRSFRWENEEPIQFNFGPGPETGDIGDPANILVANSTSRELLSPGYFSSLALDCNVGNVYLNITQYTGQTVSTEAPLEDRMPYLGADAPSRYLNVMTHQQPRMSWDEARASGGEGGNKYERSPELVTSCGPFTLSPEQEVTIVFAEVIGEMDRAKIVAGGVENVNLLATESRDALLENVQAARELYGNGYLVDVPPPTPTNRENSLTISPIGGGLEISWPAMSPEYSDPYTGVHDLAGYRVYRSSYFTTGPWALVADLPLGEVQDEGGEIVFADEGLPLGVGVYYTVTSYDTDGNESGKVNANRFPVYPLRAANDEFPEKVYVVPNPFRQNSRLLGAGEEYRMEFIGLPAEAIIRIYTIAGDLVREIQHNDGSGAEAWGSQLTLDYQTSEWMQYVQPGIYIYHVESKVPGQEGRSYIGKFAIIR